MGDHEPAWDMELDEQLLQDLYAWIDQVPLSRPKRKIERDFSDGVMIAELVKYYFPSWVELHNYSPAHNTQQKMINWGLLNRKVFSRFDMNVPEHVMRGICIGKQGMVENLMYNLRIKIDDHLYAMEGNTSDPHYRVLFRKGKDAQKATPRPEQYDQYDDYEAAPVRRAPIVNGGAGGPKISQDSYRNANGNSIPTLRKGTNPNESVPRMLYEEKEQECMAKEEQIQILNAKIRRLEHLLHLKDVRIQDMAEKSGTAMKASGPRR